MRVFFLLIFLIYYYKKFSFFLWKILAFFISLIYILEYIMIFILKFYYIYTLILLKYKIKEFLMVLRKSWGTSSNKNYEKKKEDLKKRSISDKWWRIYYKRYMYYGFTKVYMQIFLRKIKEYKNYIYFLLFYKFKRKYNFYKKLIIKKTLLFYYWNNYNLAIYLENLKSKLFYILIYISLFEIYNITVLTMALKYNFLRLFKFCIIFSIWKRG